MTTLFARLSFAFTAILLVLGLTVLWVSHKTSQDYFLEFTQQLNAPIAMYMAENGEFIDGNAANPLWLSELAPHVMMINPSVEVYMLDNTGVVIGSSLDKNELSLKRVDLEPIHEFLHPDRVLPIRGDDPRHATDQRIFSAFPLLADSPTADTRRVAGYVYAVIAGEHYQSVFSLIRSSYSFKMLAITLSCALLLALLSGVMVFMTLTRRLKLLTNEVSKKVSALTDNAVVKTNPQRKNASLDEIDKLTSSYALMENKLIDQFCELEEKDLNRREFIANISHDLRTPLTTMQSYIETLLLKNSVLAKQEKQEYLRIAYRQSKYLGKLVSQLFTLTKLESGEVKPSLEDFCLLELAHDIVQELRIKAASRGITLSIQPDKSDGGEFDVYADIGMIHRVFVNLINNAMRYTSKNGHVVLALERSHFGHIDIFVTDTGCGMTRQQCLQVMKRYYTSAGNNEGLGGSAGLGLAIVKNILSLHDAAMKIDSVPGKGTTIRFRLSASERAALHPVNAVIKVQMAG